MAVTSVGRRVPQEIIDEILDRLFMRFGMYPLRRCCRVAKSWVPSCRRYIFYTIAFTPTNMARWLRDFPVPEESPSHHVKVLRFRLGGKKTVPARFFEYIQWFKNVEEVVLRGDGRRWSSWIPSLVGLSQSVTSLTVDTRIDLEQVWDLMQRVQLPNLDDLCLSGLFDMAEEHNLLGVEVALTGKFRGRLELTNRRTHEDIVAVLLGIPTGLHFTEVDIHVYRESLLPIVRLVEACKGTLVKLRYRVVLHTATESPDTTFDFSKSPNLQNVTFAVHWFNGDVRWIPVALSTLQSTSSPQLRQIHLEFNYRGPAHTGPGTAALDGLAHELGWAADEFIRIESQYEGSVKITVDMDATFRQLGVAEALQQWEV